MTSYKGRLMQQYFFINNQPFGKSERKFMYVHGELQRPYSNAYCCPYCGEIWARAAIVGENIQWHFVVRSCESCNKSDILNSAGSLWQSWDTELISAMPREVLLRELDLAIKHYERYSNG